MWARETLQMCEVVTPAFWKGTLPSADSCAIADSRVMTQTLWLQAAAVQQRACDSRDVYAEIWSNNACTALAAARLWTLRVHSQVPDLHSGAAVATGTR